MPEIQLYLELGGSLPQAAGQSEGLRRGTLIPGGGVCDRDRVTDCTLHHDRNSQGLQVRWSGAADERHPV